MRLTRFCLAAALACAVAAPAGAQDADWDKVVQAAKREGKVVVYNAAIGSPFYKAAVEGFEKKHGIRVETLDVRASEMRERIRTEQAAGRYIGDITQPGEATSKNQEREGVFQPHGGVPNIKNLRREFPADNVRIPTFVQAYGVLINTNLVKPADEPKSWKDLLDPKWKGKILSDDPRAIGGGAVMFFATHDALGKEFNERLATQGLTFSRDLRNDERRVARGEFPIYLPEVFAFSLDLKGLPVKLLLPSEGSPYVTIVSVMLKNAPHPNAARLLMDHFLEIETQLLYSNGGQVPVVNGAVERTNEPVRHLAGAKLMGTTTAERQNEMLELAKQIYK
jgi:iron(III) transport system substrate-binding protein